MNISSLRQYKNTDYYASANGEVYKLTKVKEFIKKDRCDYRSVRIHVGKKQATVSRLVWEAFNGTISKGYVVEHINGCSTINELHNLRMVKISDGRRFKGTNRKTRKIIDEATGKVYKGTRTCAEALNTTREIITRIRNGNQPQRKGIKVAWYDDINGKAFIGNYNEYYKKYMQGKYD